MNSTKLKEVWLRGPISGIEALLQPVAHALLQTEEELAQIGIDFPKQLLWEKPAGLASVGFHLQHLRGILDRLFTYARGESLSESQLNYLLSEGQPPSSTCTYQELLADYRRQVGIAFEQLKEIDPDSLTELRYVGRAMIPSTQLGLLFHAAEHAQRHVGQLIVTARILRQAPSK
ncbi:DinB family protein [Dyadobacter jejuensis]|uniref:DinB family protein n=1 Tax=Dyadobacter jejuensis TaxID=1082580 RepID=A0A316AG67_9BACT|nr:DinB family protein [Dyadobacter jejuensis]PWJ56776.1 DinB family protein [Dyadobacter jejuensis]